MDIADQLRKLAELRAEGLLSAEEFDQQRRAALARSLSSVPPSGAPGGSPSGELRAVGAYDLLDRVGEGGMGSVWRARHRVAAMAGRQGGDVALKLLHPHLAGKPGLAERFRREAEALAALDHPNIVRVHDLVEESGRLALVMEWVPGRALSEVIGRETGPVPWDRARPMVAAIFDAVAHAHARGVVHRDLKPDNIRVTPDGTVKVLDFGIARLGEQRGRTKTGTGMGTVDYMAPEQYADAKAVDERADVYALGMTLYELLAGRLPWEPDETEFGVLQRKHRGDIPPPTAFYPSIPPWVVEAVGRALRPDPAERLASVVALREALGRGAVEERARPVDTPTTPPSPVRPTTTTPPRRPPTPPGAGAAPPAAAPAPPTLGSLLFSTEGRIGRWTYASVAGAFAAFLVTWSIQAISMAVWAPPAALSDPNALFALPFEERGALLADVPTPARALVLLSWLLGSGVGGFVAAYAGQARRLLLAGAIGALWTANVAINVLFLMPHPLWMTLGGLLLCLPLALAGGWQAGRLEQA